MATVQQVLAGMESRFHRVFGEVAEKAVVLGLMTNKVVEGVLLPEAACGAEEAIELGASEAFPGFALAQHRVTIWKGDEQVKVVGHDDKAMHLIAVAVKVEQAIAHDGGASWVS